MARREEGEWIALSLIPSSSSSLLATPAPSLVSVPPSTLRLQPVCLASKPPYGGVREDLLCSTVRLLRCHPFALLLRAQRSLPAPAATPTTLTRLVTTTEKALRSGVGRHVPRLFITHSSPGPAEGLSIHVGDPWLQHLTALGSLLSQGWRREGGSCSPASAGSSTRACSVVPAAAPASSSLPGYHRNPWYDRDLTLCNVLPGEVQDDRGALSPEPE